MVRYVGEFVAWAEALLSFEHEEGKKTQGALYTHNRTLCI